MGQQVSVGENQMTTTRANIRNYIKFFIFSVLIFSVSSILICKNPKYENPCDPYSKTYQDSLIAKALLGDNSVRCSLASAGTSTGTTTGPPTSLTYSTTAYIYTQNNAISTVTPTLTGGTPTSCTASPALPSGLSLASSTCVLSGTPTTGTPLTTYTITASNSAGSATGSIIIRTLFSIPKYLYVANYSSSDIYSYSVDSVTGVLTPVNTIASGSNTKSVAIDPTGKYLYSVDLGTDMIQMHQIDQTTGALSAASSSLAAGTDPQSVTIHPNGQFAYVADNASTVYIYSINQTDGSLTFVSSAVTGLDAVWIRVHPNGKFAYVVCKNPTNLIYVYTINQTTGALTASGSSIATGTDPRSIEIEPSGIYAYTVELNVNHISYWTINQSTGELSGGSFLTVPGTAPETVAVHPNGLYVYAGYDNSGNGEALRHTINSTDGSITPGTPASTAAMIPIRLVVDPSGKFAYGANWGGNNVLYYSINQITGDLSYVSGYGSGGNPDGIAITGTN